MLMFLLSCTKEEQSTEGIVNSTAPQVDEVTNTVTSTIDYRIYNYNEQSARTMDDEQAKIYRERFTEQFDAVCKSFFNEVLSVDIDSISNVELSFFEFDNIVYTWVECDAEGEGVPQIMSMQFDFESCMPLHVEIACTDAKSYVYDAVGLKELAQKYADYIGIPVENTSYTFQNVASQRCVLCADTEYEIGISVSVEYGNGTDDVITLAATKRSMDLSASVVLPDARDICVGTIYDEQRARVKISESEAAAMCKAEISTLTEYGALPAVLQTDTYETTVSGLYNVELCTENTIDQTYLTELKNNSAVIICLLDANTGKLLYVKVSLSETIWDLDIAAQGYASYFGANTGKSTTGVNGEQYSAFVYQGKVSFVAGINEQGDFILRSTTMPVKYN